jgi:hypothetical protein
VISVEKIQHLYDQNRFLDAFRESAEYWKPSGSLDGFSSDELILGARLAVRLGGSRLSRWLYRAASEIRPGVRMWMVANYVDCFSVDSSTDWPEIRANCARALSGLPHDRCARYRAHVQAEACALLGDEAGLLATWKEHRAYFDGELSEGEWFKKSRRHLLDDIPKMAQFLEQNERGKYRWSLRLLKWRNRYQTMVSSVARAKGWFPPVVWWLFFLGVAAIIANLV